MCLFDHCKTCLSHTEPRRGHGGLRDYEKILRYPEKPLCYLGNVSRDIANVVD